MASIYGQTVGGLLADAAGNVYQSVYDAGSFLAANPQTAGLLAGQMAPGAGSVDAAGYYPDPFQPNRRLPSLRENIRQGNYLDAGFQGLGLLGDAVIAVPPLAAGLKAPRAIQVARRGAKNADTSYRIQHQPRSPQQGAARLDEMTVAAGNQGGVFPEDLYSDDGLRIYGNAKSKADQKNHEIIRSVRGNPDAKVTIYRAVPKGVEEINEGDFVTLSQKYAEQHAESGFGLSGDEVGQVIKMEVEARDLYNDGNDMNEFGFFPKPEPKTEAEEKARSVLDMLETGQADQIDALDLRNADDAYLAQNYDLPMDYKSRMDRAHKMGFNTNTVYYRGQRNPYITEADYQGFSNLMFATDEADIANTYIPYPFIEGNSRIVYEPEMQLGGYNDKTRGADGGSIFPLLLKDGEDDVFLDTYGRNYNAIPEDTTVFIGSERTNLADEFLGDLDAETIARHFGAYEGAPIVRFGGLEDVGSYEENAAVVGDRLSFLSEVAAVNDPTARRSIFARFDPRLENLSNLNAGLLIAPVGGAALASGLLAPNATEQEGQF